jgi:hypothetical protein
MSEIKKSVRENLKNVEEIKKIIYYHSDEKFDMTGNNLSIETEHMDFKKPHVNKDSKWGDSSNYGTLCFDFTFDQISSMFTINSIYKRLRYMYAGSANGSKTFIVSLNTPTITTYDKDALIDFVIYVIESQKKSPRRTPKKSYGSDCSSDDETASLSSTESESESIEQTSKSNKKSKGKTHMKLCKETSLDKKCKG